MIILASDLDNTLIYSYKREIGQDKKVVEIYQGREVSYMTKKTHKLLNDMYDKLLFVPVTTRSLKQYERIQFHDSWIPHLALVSNGGILLKDGIVDEKWLEDSMKLVEPAENELQKAEKLLQDDEFRTLDVRRVDGLFVYTKSSKEEKTIHMLMNILDESIVDVFHNGCKIYILPKKLNKGDALHRFREYYGNEIIVAAGDSAFDIPMLREADISYFPESLYQQIKDVGNIFYIVPEGKIMSDVLLENVKNQVEHIEL